MTSIPATAFGVLLWGSIAGVGLVFAYLLVTLARDAGWP